MLLAACAGPGNPTGTTTTALAAPTTTTVTAGLVEDVPDGGYPYQVALLDASLTEHRGRPVRTDLDRWYCGGSLIDDRHVLTAAHCLLPRHDKPFDAVRDIRVAAGRTVMTSSQGQLRRVVASAIHPRYDGIAAAPYDVGVITLARPVAGIEPVELVAAGEERLTSAGTMVTLTGWGDARTLPKGQDRNKPRDRMKAAHFPLVSDRSCQRAYHNSEQMLPAPGLFLCTGTKAGIGTCLGDSGGPLVVEAAGARVEVGLVSVGLGCGDPRYPSVFTQLSNPSINAFVRAELAGSG
jgi:secreted trypsin-like serine protease